MVQVAEFSEHEDLQSVRCLHSLLLAVEVLWAAELSTVQQRQRSKEGFKSSAFPWCIFPCSLNQLWERGFALGKNAIKSLGSQRILLLHPVLKASLHECLETGRWEPARQKGSWQAGVGADIEVVVSSVVIRWGKEQMHSAAENYPLALFFFRENVNICTLFQGKTLLSFQQQLCAGW